MRIWRNAVGKLMLADEMAMFNKDMRFAISGVEFTTKNRWISINLHVEVLVAVV